VTTLFIVQSSTPKLKGTLLLSCAMGTMMPNPYGDMETIIYATLSTQTAAGRWTTDAEYHTML
jgi:hypothetical protein